MRRFHITLVVLLLFATFGSAGAAQTAARGATPQADLAGVPPSSLTNDQKAKFETYIENTQTKLGVPGASVAIVQGGDIVYLQGFGVRKVGGTEKVSPDTLMMIGSDTKSMTSMLAATLVDDGWLSWDTPIVQLLPNFVVADPQLTQQLTVADAFCACTGLPQRDAELTLNFDSMTPDRMIASVADFPLTAPLGQKFQYSNQMYAIGGYAAAVAGGASPDDLFNSYRLLMRDRILNPIGMERSTFALEDVLASGDYAVPHGSDLFGQTKPVSLLADYGSVSAAAPAGALWSSAREMARYVQTQLADGVSFNGTRVVSAKNLERTRAARVPISPNAQGLPPPLSDYAQAYGMGWYVGEYKGQPLLSHSGSTLGFVSEVALLPENDLGIVILTNGGANAYPFTLAVQYRLLELLANQSPEIDPLINQLIAANTSQTAQILAQLGQPDPAAVAPYLGRYSNPALGEIDLDLEGAKLVLDAGELRSELQPVGDPTSPVDVYIFTDPPLAGAPVSILLRLDAGGDPEIAATIRGETDETYVFTRVEAAAAATPGP
jgi:CubicO group peptidase (beta-lactamase class C family)